MEQKTGGCHCGQVRYAVTIDLGQPVVECNCSMCQSKGLLLAFVPESAMQITSGEADLTEYRFNTKKIAHLFCKTCGVESFGKGVDPEGKSTYAINVRTIDGINLAALERVPYDGRAV